MTTTIALTGGTGFVGTEVMRQAAAQGIHIRALTRRPQASREGVTWVEGTLADGAALERLVTDADAVLHVAGVVNAPDRAGFDAGNVAGTQAVVDAALAAGLWRFVHVSSLAAREPALSDYGASKACAEGVVVGSSLDWVMVRPPAIYGPNDCEMLDLFRMARHRIMTLPPAGRLSVIHVSDLARVLLSLATVETLPNSAAHATLEVDDGRPGAWTHDAFAQAIGRAVDRKVLPIALPAPVIRAGAWLDGLFRGKKAKLTPDRARYFCHPDWTVDPAKMPPVALWTPQVDTETGLVETAAAYRAKGWLG